jgi:hypothetical protein
MQYLKTFKKIILEFSINDDYSADAREWKITGEIIDKLKNPTNCICGYIIVHLSNNDKKSSICSECIKHINDL